MAEGRQEVIDVLHELYTRLVLPELRAQRQLQITINLFDAINQFMA